MLTAIYVAMWLSALAINRRDTTGLCLSMLAGMFVLFPSVLLPSPVEMGRDSYVAFGIFDAACAAMAFSLALVTRHPVAMTLAAVSAALASINYAAWREFPTAYTLVYDAYGTMTISAELAQLVACIALSRHAIAWTWRLVETTMKEALCQRKPRKAHG